MNELVQGRAADLAFESQGQGKTLLLVHGFPLDRSMWRPQREALSDVCRVIVPDLRGFGESGPLGGPHELPTKPLTMASHADDLARLLDELAIDEPVYLAGLSMGGYIALEFWRRHGHRLGGLGLLDTKSAADTDEARKNREQVATTAETTRNASELALAMVPKLLSAQSLSDPELTECLEQTKQVMASIDARTFAAAQRGMALRSDFDAELPKIDIPCMVVCGSEDVITPPADMKRMAARLPHARYLQLAGAGHLPPLERPDSVNQALRNLVIHDLAVPD